MNSLKYDEVEGIQALQDQLLVYLAEFQSENRPKTHYVLFRLGGQKSLIRVDAVHPHFYFWYHDLLGRPMTKSVRDVLARFLWEHNGQKEAFFSKLEHEESELV